MTADTLVEARWVIPVIPRNTVLENHTVVFSGGRIADILPTEAALQPSDRTSRAKLPKSRTSRASSSCPASSTFTRTRP